MNIAYSKASVEAIKGDALVLPVYTDWKNQGEIKTLDTLLKGELVKRANKAEFKAGKGSVFILQTYADLAVDRVVLLGLGKRKALDAEALWDHIHGLLTKLNSPSIATIAFHLGCESEQSAEQVMSTASQAFVNSVYCFDRYKSKKEKQSLKKVLLFGSDLPATKAKVAISRGEAVGTGINIARDLVNEPAETMTPAIFANQAKALAKAEGFTCKVENKAQIEKRNMGLFLAVARGSVNPPKLITMTYSPKNPKGKPIVLVGKGLMYDSGGYSLKPSASMETMKCDMGGSATVMGTMVAISRIKPNQKVIAIVAACENMIGGGAYRVGDIFTAMNGKTVEVLNTDAEGRLTLADALTYATSFKPKLIVDLATLTGACVVALGEQTVGAFCSDDAVSADITGAFKRGGEDVWELPLNPRLKPLIKSDIADLKNVGGRWGGAITAALFLNEFTEKTSWAHLDIAGPAFSKSASGHLPKGGSGVGVASLVQLIDPKD